MNAFSFHAYIAQREPDAFDAAALQFAEQVMQLSGDAHTRLLHGNHPDFLTLRPNGTMIRIDQIRQLLLELSVRPYEGKQRVVAIHYADWMNAQAQNCLLKTLEEPPNGTVFLLLCQQPDRLLETVRSRCALWRAPQLADESAETESPLFWQRVEEENDVLSLASFFSEDRQEQKEQLGRLLASASARLKQSVCGTDSLPPAQWIRRIDALEQSVAMLQSNVSPKLCAQWLCIHIKEDLS